MLPSMLRRSPRSSVWSLLLGLMLLCWALRYFNDARQLRQGDDLDESTAGSNALFPSLTHNFTVHLVMATVTEDDISWTANIANKAMGNLTIVRYFANDQKALHHPAQNKGREASMYLTYITDHYDELPELVIFTHADEHPWHVESILNDSMACTLSHLDLYEAQQRGYANLRVSWMNACPDWIDTTRTFAVSVKQEEPYVRQAFLENFPPTNEQGAINGVPRYLTQPCCSQFITTRDTILAVPKQQYEKHLQWMFNTDLPDQISGRTWEHLFQYLWTKRAVDCPIEWKALCKMYHICFLNAVHYKNYIELGNEKRYLEEKTSSWDASRDPAELQKTSDRIKAIERALVDGMVVALERGKDIQWRSSGMGDLYVE